MTDDERALLLKMAALRFDIAKKYKHLDGGSSYHAMCDLLGDLGFVVRCPFCFTHVITTDVWS